jgi:DNA-binding NtrC family response regulator
MIWPELMERQLAERRDLIRETLITTNGDRKSAAVKLSMARSTLYSILRGMPDLHTKRGA